MYECQSVLVPPDCLFFSTGGKSQNSTVSTPSRHESLLSAFLGVVSLQIDSTLMSVGKFRSVRKASLLRFFSNVHIAAVQKEGKIGKKPC